MATHQVCTSCSSGLRNWLNKKTPAMPFAVPMIWRESKDHFQDCYVCLVNVKGFSSKHRSKIYPNIDSALRTVHTTPQCLHQFLLKMHLPASLMKRFLTMVTTGSSDSTGSQYEPEENLKPILFSQEQLYDGHSSGSSDLTGSQYEPEENLKPILFSQKQ